MADYYPLLIRAISSLPQNTAEARRAVVDRARTALLRQLRGVDPPLPEGEITRERLSLEEAIRRVEAEFAPQDNARPSADEAPADETPDGEVANGEAAAEVAEISTAGAVAAEGPAPEGEGDAAAEGTPRPGTAPAEGDGSADRRPAVRRGEVRSRGPANTARQRTRAPASEGPSWRRMALWGVIAAVVLAVLAFVVVSRDSIFDGEARQTAASPAAPATVDQPKNEDRVGSAPGDAARKAPAAARGPAAVGTQRAVLLEESPGGASPPQSFEGTVTWKTETFNAGPGLPPDIGVRGDITIPERQIAMSFVLRRNTDQTLPASHTIEISFQLPQDFAFGGVANVPGVRAKPNQQAQGTPLAGLSVRVSPTLFLVGLSPLPTDRQRNIALLQAYPWFDTPITYTNNKKAVMVFEKGVAGEQAFNDAFSAWGELIQQPQQPAGQPNGG